MLFDLWKFLTVMPLNLFPCIEEKSCHVPLISLSQSDINLINLLLNFENFPFQLRGGVTLFERTLM